MSNDIIDRNGEEEARFGDKVIEFADNLYQLCHKVKKELVMAEDNMQDESGRSALQYIDQTMNEILSVLADEDGPRTLGARCRRQGQALTEQEQKRFNRGR